MWSRLRRHFVLMTKSVTKGMHFGRKEKIIESIRRQKPTCGLIPNRKSSIALAHAYAAVIACTVFLTDVLWSLQIHGAWLRLAVVARVVSRHFLSCAHLLSLPP